MYKTHPAGVFTPLQHSQPVPRTATATNPPAGHCLFKHHTMILSEHHLNKPNLWPEGRNETVPPVRRAERPECQAGRGKENKAEVAALPGAAQQHQAGRKPRVPTRQRLRGAPVTPGGCSTRCQLPEGLHGAN